MRCKPASSTGDVAKSRSPACSWTTWKPGDTFLDVGANVGYFTLLASRAVGPGGSVHAFEPSPLLCQRLVADLRRNPFATNVTVHQVAVSDHRGTGWLSLPTDAPSPYGEQHLASQPGQRNIGDYLDPMLARAVDRQLARAVNDSDWQRALNVANGIATQLEDKHPSAAATLREGLEDMAISSPPSAAWSPSASPRTRTALLSHPGVRSGRLNRLSFSLELQGFYRSTAVALNGQNERPAFMRTKPPAALPRARCRSGRSGD